MSPRPANPSIRTALVETAARLLADEGAGALTTRRLAAEVGTSTMALYTHFGGMDELLAAARVEAFRRLAEQMAVVACTDDPVEDLAGLGRAYHRNARANPALYRLMFGGGIAETALDPADEAMTIGTFQTLVDATRRCMEAGRFSPGDPVTAAEQLWASAHGVVMLELAGVFTPEAADACLAHSMTTLALGLGDRTPPHPPAPAPGRAPGGARFTGPVPSPPSRP